MSAAKYSFINCATILDVEAAQGIDQEQGSCVHKVLAGIHTYHMEYDSHD
ncbi:hypothetical protein A2U01_0002157, partial [Trifolium medium]|nr:hypothetical protein [Trifolium medium]